MPRMLRNAPILRRGALLIRGPWATQCKYGFRLCGAAYRTMLRIAGSTLHRVRDTTKRVVTASRVNVENIDVWKFWKIRAPASSAAALETRASANTSGPDFTWA